jgi:hypothetical protein
VLAVGAGAFGGLASLCAKVGLDGAAAGRLVSAATAVVVPVSASLVVAVRVAAGVGYVLANIAMTSWFARAIDAGTSLASVVLATASNFALTVCPREEKSSVISHQSAY